jgi:hypothetical protein
MATPNHTPAPAEAGLGSRLLQAVDRRLFLRYTGLTAAATGLILAGCDDDENTEAGTVNVGSGDTGVLNYAYALEQLEAAFYAQVKMGTYYSGANAAEKAIFDDLAAHELIHRELFKTALAGNAIKALEPDFSSINFNDRTSVLNAAKTFEDLGVAAYNGAGQFISDATYLTLAGKIVSVEARHAALIRDLIQNGSFVGSDVVDPASGLERSKSPGDVAAAANGYLKSGSKLNVSNLR